MKNQSTMDKKSNHSSFDFRVLDARSALLPFILSQGVFLTIGIIALYIIPTTSLFYAVVILCGALEGYLFCFLVLSLTFIILRRLHSIITSISALLCRKDGEYCTYLRYQAVPVANTEQSSDDCQDNAQTVPPNSRQHKKLAFDLVCIVFLYFSACFLAWWSWAPSILFNDLDSLSSSELINTSQAIHFPADFKFGAATSAYQVEGGLYNNQWAEFENSSDGHIRDNQHCGDAADMWNLFDSDLENMIELGLDAFRFSVEWSRIEPEQGVFNDTAIDRYANWVTKLRAHDIEPIVTLHHFTNPIWFENIGAFENPDAPSIILPFVRKVAERFGTDVQRWITINEIMVYAGNGYLEGEFPPGRSGEMGTMLRVVANMLSTHHEMYRAIKEMNHDAQTSIAKNTILYYPYSYFDLPAIIAAGVAGVYYNAMPVRILQHQGTIDYYGLNSYIRMTVGPMGASMGFTLPKEQQNDMGWDLDPNALYQVVKQYNKYDPGAKILITEHGAADGEKPDTRRLLFLRNSLIGLAKAVKEGVHITGYLHWSLVDNWEWSSGFTPKFGLYSIDLPHSQARNLTEGGKLYKDIIRSHRVDIEKPQGR